MSKRVIRVESQESSQDCSHAALDSSRSTLITITSGLARRYRAERRFRLYGIAALGFAGLMLLLLLGTILRPGISGFFRHEVRVEVSDQTPMPNGLDYHALTHAALRATLPEEEAEALAQNRPLRKQLYGLAGTFAANDVAQQMGQNVKHWGTDSLTIALSDNADQFFKGRITRAMPEAERPLTDQQISWLEHWKAEGRIRNTLNTDFFTRGDSRAPEGAGFFGSIVGSLIMLVICLGVAIPVAIMAAITLEEFAKKTRVAELLEIIINNLAAVPSIIYGLLGLSVYLQWMHLPRSSALVGGLTMAMLIMPVMIIAARAAIRAVPPSMRQAATALGATRLQVVRHHVLPYAMPGILTGTILSICRALGETAPLLMIGMVAFVADVPRGPTDPATAMPVQIYLWASSPELGFVEKTSSGILVLLVILLILNAAAIRLRNRSQLTWN